MIAPVQLAFAPPAGPQEPEPYSPEERVLGWLRRYVPTTRITISRTYLGELTGLSDRAVRRARAS